MDEDFIRSRISELRLKKGVSEYKMSYDIGHSKGYIQGITSGRAMPSMREFLYICEYLGVTPGDFFDAGVKNPALLQRALDGMRELDDGDLELVAGVAERLRR